MPNILRTAASVVCVVVALAILTFEAGYSLGLFIATVFLWPRISKAEAAAAQAKLMSALNQWEQLKNKWKTEASVVLFDTEIVALKDAFSKFKGLPAEKTRRLADLNARRQEIQKHRYLDQFRLADTLRNSNLRIPGIGAGRVDVLRSFGVETADDIDSDKIRRIPRFGPELCDRLLTWRAQHEATFRFNPNLPVDRTELNALNADIASKETAFISRLRTGPANLVRINQEILSARNRLWPLLGQAWEQVKSADAEKRNPLSGKNKSALTKSGGALPGSVVATPGLSGSTIGSTVRNYAINLPAAVGFIGVITVAALYYFIHAGPNNLFARTDVAQTPAIGAAQTADQTVQREVVYVQAIKANVRAEPSANARVVSVQNSATKLYVFQRSGNWIQIGNDVPIGWIYGTLLASTPPSLSAK